MGLVNCTVVYEVIDAYLSSTYEHLKGVDYMM